MVETNVGKGRLFLMAPEILFRSQPHGNYKLFFNGLYLVGRGCGCIGDSLIGDCVSDWRNWDWEIGDYSEIGD